MVEAHLVVGLGGVEVAHLGLGLEGGEEVVVVTIDDGRRGEGGWRSFDDKRFKGSHEFFLTEGVKVDWPVAAVVNIYSCGHGCSSYFFFFWGTKKYVKIRPEGL